MVHHWAGTLVLAIGPSPCGVPIKWLKLPHRMVSGVLDKVSQEAGSKSCQFLSLGWESGQSAHCTYCRSNTEPRFKGQGHGLHHSVVKNFENILPSIHSYSFVILVICLFIYSSKAILNIIKSATHPRPHTSLGHAQISAKQPRVLYQKTDANSPQSPSPVACSWL